jgi:hypothetical protein
MICKYLRKRGDCMKHMRKLVLALAVLGACVLVVGVAFAAPSKNNAKAPAAKSAPSTTKQATHESTAGDPDNVQSGDQTGAERPDKGEQSKSESAGDGEQGQPGEPAQGHEDPPGNVNHDCTGDCQE